MRAARANRGERSSKLALSCARARSRLFVLRFYLFIVDDLLISPFLGFQAQLDSARGDLRARARELISRVRARINVGRARVSAAIDRTRRRRYSPLPGEGGGEGETRGESRLGFARRRRRRR